MRVLFDQVDQADQLGVLRQESLEGQEELIETVLLERDDSAFVVGNDEALD